MGLQLEQVCKPKDESRDGPDHGDEDWTNEVGEELWVAQHVEDTLDRVAGRDNHFCQWMGCGLVGNDKKRNVEEVGGDSRVLMLKEKEQKYGWRCLFLHAMRAAPAGYFSSGHVFFPTLMSPWVAVVP